MTVVTTKKTKGTKKCVIKIKRKLSLKIIIKRHNVLTEEINKIALSSNDDKRMQSIDLIETYVYGMSKDLVSKKEVIECNNTIKRSKND